MTDLQAAVVNDDAVDDQLQESLPVLKRGIVQPDLNLRLTLAVLPHC